MTEKKTNRRKLLTNSQKTESSKPLILFRLLILSQHNFLSLTALRTTTTPLALRIAILLPHHPQYIRRSSNTIMSAHRAVGHMFYCSEKCQTPFQVKYQDVWQEGYILALSSSKVGNL